MKRFCGAVLMWALAFAMAAVACAEEAAAVAAVRFDWTGIAVAVIGLLSAAVSGGAAYVWKKWIQPWISRHDLLEQAQIVVNAVEALLGRYNGEDKWALALQKMRDRGFYVESQMVIDALKAAWQELDLTQMIAGVKAQEAQTGMADGCSVAQMGVEELRVFLNMSGYGLPEHIPEDEAEAKKTLLAYLAGVLKARE